MDNRFNRVQFSGVKNQIINLGEPISIFGNDNFQQLAESFASALNPGFSSGGGPVGRMICNRTGRETYLADLQCTYIYYSCQDNAGPFHCNVTVTDCPGSLTAVASQ